MQQDEYTFKGNKSFTELIGIEQLPMILNWEIGQEPCDAAQKRVDYACKPNSKCVDRTISNGSGSSGYFCQCLPGYEGNPYLPDGCQGDQSFNLYTHTRTFLILNIKIIEHLHYS